MLDYVYGAMIVAFWVAFLFGPIMLFVLRFIYVIINKPSRLDTVKVLLLPCSIGLFLVEKQNTQFKKYYEWLYIIFLICAVLASIFLIYLEVA